MGQLKDTWPFDVPCDAAVVTSTYVTHGNLPITYVSHEIDADGDTIWQFHCDNSDYSPEVIALVRLDEVVKLDSSILTIAHLPIGFSARRTAKFAPWSIFREQ